ncbi:hypothetical protein G6F57_023192 [Rhizopus arrhizus]|nr:hypothetical protein G6F57_023192 [Rhizopus arrhizus]
MALATLITLTDIQLAYGPHPLLDHAAHLTLHGVLHSLGYDHIKARDAKRMEALETATLAQMGIADPYVAAD